MEIISNNKTEKNTVAVEFKVDAAAFEEALQKAYLKKRKDITIPGFRKGKATRKMIEANYGEQVFFEDAVNGMYQKSVSDVIDELKLDVVDMPNIEVVSVSKADGVSFKAEFTVKPEVEISDYAGLKVKKAVKTITDDDINAELKGMQEKGARMLDVTDRASEKGDLATFDFEGFCDGKAFEGGTAKDFKLEIGSGQFIPGFEDQMVGKNIGEDFDVNVRFPVDYQAKELADKEAVFKCKINGLKKKELPELDDEFAKDVSEFDTLEELKKDISKKLAEKAEQDADNQFENDLTDMVVEKLDAEVPAVMFENRIDDMVRDWEYNNKMQGITVKDYLKYTNTTMEKFREFFKAPAEKQVKLRLALEKIAEKENIEVLEDAVEEQYKKLAETYKMEVEKVKGIIAAENIKKDLLCEKAFDFVKNSAKVTKPRAKKAAAAADDKAE